MRENELPVIRTIPMKEARVMSHGNPDIRVLVGLYQDGVISSAVMRKKNGEWVEECTYSSAPGQDAVYWPWIAHLSAVGYDEHPIEVESEVGKTNAR